MKKLATLMLGLTLAFGSAVAFAQDAPKKDDTNTKAGKKKGSKKKNTEPPKSR